MEFVGSILSVSNIIHIVSSFVNDYFTFFSNLKTPDGFPSGVLVFFDNDFPKLNGQLDCYSDLIFSV